MTELQPSEPHMYRRVNIGWGVLGSIVVSGITVSLIFGGDTNHANDPITSQLCALSNPQKPPQQSTARVLIKERHWSDFLDKQTAIKTSENLVAAGLCTRQGRPIRPVGIVACQINDRFTRTLKPGQYDLDCTFVLAETDSQLIQPDCTLQSSLPAASPDCVSTPPHKK